MIRRLGPIVGLLVCALVATAEPERTSFRVDGRHDVHGPYRATIELTPQADGLLVTRTVTYSRTKKTEVLVGRGRWTGNKLDLTLSPPVSKRGGAAGKVDALHGTGSVTARAPSAGALAPASSAEKGQQTNMRLVVDPESGFCVERSLDANGSSRALGRVQGSSKRIVLPKEKAPSTEDLAGWVIKVPGEVRHAVRDKNTVYVAAGQAGLQIVDLEKEAVTRAVALPGSARHVVVSGSIAWVTAQLRGLTRIHVVDLALGRRIRTLTSKKTSVLVQTPKAVVAVAAGEIRFLDAAGAVRAKARTSRAGSRPPGVAVAAGLLHVPLGRGGGLALIDLKSRRAVEMIPARDWLHDVVRIGDQAFVAGTFGGLGVIDLEQRTYTKLGRPGVLRLYSKGKRLFALTRTALLELDAQGKVVAESKLGVTLPDAPHGEHWIVDVRDGSAILSLRGLGLVVLEL